MYDEIESAGMKEAEEVGGLVVVWGTVTNGVLGTCRSCVSKILSAMKNDERVHSTTKVTVLFWVFRISAIVVWKVAETRRVATETAELSENVIAVCTESLEFSEK